MSSSGFGDALAAQWLQFQVDVEMDASRERIWQALFAEINDWWLPDFRQMGPESIVTFDPRPGGSGLLEMAGDGGGLLWYSVQLHSPESFAIYLVGHLAPEWGGPATSMLKIAVESRDGEANQSVLTIVDAHHGNVDSKRLESTRDGWAMLFGDGLKKHVERAN